MKKTIFVLLSAAMLSACGKTIVDPPDPPAPAITVNATEEKLIGNWRLLREEDSTFIGGAPFTTQEYNYTSDFRAAFLRTRNGDAPSGLPADAVKDVRSSAQFDLHGPGPSTQPSETTDPWFVNSAGRLYAGQFYWDILSLTGTAFSMQYVVPGGTAGDRSTYTLYFQKL